MALPAFLAHAADAWAALYDGHHAVSVTVRLGRDRLVCDGRIR